MSESNDDIRFTHKFRSGRFGTYVNYGRRLLQPRYWPELRRFAARRVMRRPVDQRRAEEAWNECRQMAVDPDAAVVALGLPASILRSLADDHGNRLAAAQIRVEATGNPRMGGGADVDLLYSLCVATGAERVLETGVAFGWSSLAILSAIEARPGGRLISVDMPYLGSNLDNLVGLAVPEEIRHRWTLIRGADRDWLTEAIIEIRPIDLAHYDSDKSERGRRWAYPLIWNALKPGGILMSDDIEDNLAFLEFAREVGEAPVVVRAPDGAKFSGILRKAG